MLTISESHMSAYLRNPHDGRSPNLPWRSDYLRSSYDGRSQKWPWRSEDLRIGDRQLPYVNTRVAQMAKKCRTYWDQCFSHLFYLVILENGQKVQKKCCLRVPNFKSRNGLIYIVISGQKWLFLHQLSFGPLNGSENTNKPLETNGHMPIPYPGPK